MWFILLSIIGLVLLFILSKTERNRRVQLIELINLHKIHHIEWHHRGKVFQIILTLKSIAQPSRNRSTGHNISKANGIIIKYFWLEGKLCNTDSFAMKNLRFKN
jgi:hypothetical protein